MHGASPGGAVPSQAMKGRCFGCTVPRLCVDPRNHERQKAFVPYLQQARSLLLETVLGLKFTVWVIAPWKILPRESVKGLSHSTVKGDKSPFPPHPEILGKGLIMSKYSVQWQSHQVLTTQ